MPAPLAEVVEMLGSLPGIGPKTALRLGLNLLRRPASEVEALASSLVSAELVNVYAAGVGRDGGL